MPVNEIFATSYLRIKYTTWAKEHSLTIYLNGLIREAISPTEDEGLQFKPATTAIWQPLDLNIMQIVLRAYKSQGVIAPVVNSIEGWQSVPDGPNLFVGYANPTAISSGFTVQGVASGFTQWRFRTVDVTSPRQQVQLNFFESAGTASPQRVPLVTQPDTDNGTVEWFVTKGIPNWLCSQDGFVVTAPFAKNFGYNRRLARDYGKRLTP